MFVVDLSIMEIAALGHLSKLELISLLISKEQVIEGYKDKENYYQGELARYQELVAQLQRMLFGQKRERFEGESKQEPLPLEVKKEVEEQQEKELRETISYVKAKKPQSTHPGRSPLPNHLPVEEIEIHPQGNLEEMVCIGKEVTEELDCIPAKLFIRRYIRYKYVPKDQEKTGILMGELPERVIDKGIPGAGLLASILVDKYMDHLPLYRQRQRFLREKIPITSSTLEGWVRQGLERIEILYEHLVADIKNKGYLQIDETPIRVLESNKKGATHQGYYWVYHSPIEGIVLFEYEPSRSGQGVKKLLSGFQGYLQSDGYQVYERLIEEELIKNRLNEPKITHLACWAHAIRKFEQALSNDKERSEVALLWIQELYQVEAQAREGKLTPFQRKELRLDKSLPIINQLGKWITQQVKDTLPKSQIGKAMRYSIARWDALSAYLYDGLLEIDNNLVENAIRPVALGRKNYLFAGSHAAAQRAAMIYSFLAICKKHEVNPFEWLKYTLQNILSIPYKDLRNLYPHNFKNNM